MKPEYDIVVVGGGPAGLAAAISAAKNEVDVLLVETHDEIGLPVCCAEGISTSGLKRIVEPEEEWIRCRIDGAKLFSPSGDSIFVDHPDAGFILDRAKFEQHLANLAIQSGVEVLTGARAENPVNENGACKKVDVHSSGTVQTVRMKILIAADGVESSIARQLGLTKTLLPSMLASCAQYRVTDISIEPHLLEFHFNVDGSPSGYAWMFPNSANSASIGLGVIPTMANDMSAFEYLDRFVKQRFESFSIQSRTMGIVPVFEGRRTMLQGNVMAVGDAARLIDSLTGAGIATALHSGYLAGEMGSRCIREGMKLRMLKEYPRQFMKVHGRKLRMYSLAHQIYRRMSRDDVVSVLKIADSTIGHSKLSSIDPVSVIREILTQKPSLLKYAPRLVWK